MLILLIKITCFGLWFSMMILLVLANQENSRQPDRFSIYLEDPAQAERQIHDSLHHLSPGIQLNLKISEYHPAGSELYFIASRISRKNPAISIQASRLGETN